MDREVKLGKISAARSKLPRVRLSASPALAAAFETGDLPDARSPQDARTARDLDATQNTEHGPLLSRAELRAKTGAPLEGEIASPTPYLHKAGQCDIRSNLL